MAKRKQKTSASTRRRSSAKKATALRRDEPSGRVHLYIALSLDGYIATRDGGVDWLEPYADARSRYAGFIETIGSAVMGRGTYDVAAAHGYSSFGRMPAYVVTHRPFMPPSPHVVPFTGSLPDLLVDARRHGGDIWLMGGGLVTKSFEEADLIDLWSIAYVPTLLGDGIPAFPRATLPERRLRLQGTSTSPSGVVEMRYERVR